MLRQELRNQLRDLCHPGDGLPSMGPEPEQELQADSASSKQALRPPDARITWVTALRVRWRREVARLKVVLSILRSAMHNPQQAQQETDEKQLSDVHAVFGGWKHRAGLMEGAQKTGGRSQAGDDGTKNTQTHTDAHRRTQTHTDAHRLSLSLSLMLGRHSLFFTRCFGERRAKRNFLYYCIFVSPIRPDSSRLPDAARAVLVPVSSLVCAAFCAGQSPCRVCVKLTAPPRASAPPRRR
jgi:hypothetical protein